MSSLRRDEFIAGCGALAAAVLPGRALAAAAHDDTLIRFGYQATIWGAPAMIADDAHLWAKGGANVKSIRLVLGSAARDGLIAGSLDAGSVGVTPFIVGASRADIRGVCIAAYAGRSQCVVVAKDSKYKSVGDLKGATIASALGTTTNQIFVQEIAPKFGLSKKDFRILNMNPEDMVAALETGKIQVFLAPEPFPALAQANGVGRILTNYGPYDLTPIFIAFRGAFVDQHRAAVVQALRAWQGVVKMFATQRPEVVRLLQADFAKHGGDVSIPVLTASVATLDVIPTFKKGFHAYMHEQTVPLMADGAVAKEPDWNKVLPTDLLAEAMKPA